MSIAPWAIGNRIQQRRQRVFAGRQNWLAYGRSLARSSMAALRSRNRAGLVMQRRNRPTSGNGITAQHDRRTIYVKKRMPRGRRRRWRKFVQRVNFVNEKDMGTRTAVFNVSQSFSNNASGFQCVGSVALYGQKSTTSYYNDLSNIGALENAGNPTAAAGVTVDNTSKFRFQSAVLDITFRNESGVSNGTVYQYDSRGTMEVDIYECTVGDGAEETGTSYQTFESLLATNTSVQKLANASAAVAYNQRGVTPFDLTYALGRWKIRVLKKTKYVLNNGQCATYQMRDPRRRSCQSKDLLNQDGFNRPGWTKVLFFVAKLVPGNPLGVVTGSGNWQEQLDIGITRKYMYKIEGVNEDRSSWLNA